MFPMTLILRKDKGCYEWENNLFLDNFKLLRKKENQIASNEDITMDFTLKRCVALVLKSKENWSMFGSNITGCRNDGEV